MARRARPAGTPGTRGTAARRARPCTAARPRGRARASSCRPRPDRRAGRRAAPRPGSSWPTAPSAAACPRVRAPSTTVRSGGLGGRRRLAGRAPLRCGASPRRRPSVADAGVALAAAGLRAARGLAGALPRRPRLGGAHRPARGRHRRRPRYAGTASTRPSGACGSPAAWLAGAVDAADRRGLARGTRLGRGRCRRLRPVSTRGLGRSRLRVSVDAAGADVRRPADRRLLGDLGAKHRLELGRDVAPRLARARARRAPARADRRRGCSPRDRRAVRRRRTRVRPLTSG